MSKLHLYNTFYIKRVYLIRMGWDQLVALNPYGDKVKRIRRLLHDGMSPRFMQVCTLARL